MERATTSTCCVVFAQQEDGKTLILATTFADKQLDLKKCEFTKNMVYAIFHYTTTGMK